MSNQEKIAFLKRYIYLQREIDRKLDEIDHWRSRVGKVTAAWSDVPGGGGSIYKSGNIAIIDKIVDLQDEIYKDIVNLENISHEIREIIEAVRDDKQRQLLQYRYVDGKSFEWIASSLNYSWRHTHRLHGKALGNIVITQKGGDSLGALGANT